MAIALLDPLRSEPRFDSCAVSAFPIERSSADICLPCPFDATTNHKPQQAPANDDSDVTRLAAVASLDWHDTSQLVEPALNDHYLSRRLDSGILDRQESAAVRRDRERSEIAEPEQGAGSPRLPFTVPTANP